MQVLAGAHNSVMQSGSAQEAATHLFSHKVTGKAQELETGSWAVGKTLLARAVANRTDACFIRVIGSELVQKYVGEGARMVRELFQMARSKKACLIFFDEIDAIGGARFDDGAGKLLGDIKISGLNYKPVCWQLACALSLRYNKGCFKLEAGRAVDAESS